MPEFLSFGGEKWANLTIECHDVTWLVHKAIVCEQSESFGSAEISVDKSSGQFILSLMDNFRPPPIHRILEFVYRGDYNDSIDMANAQTQEQVRALAAYELVAIGRDHVASLKNMNKALVESSTPSELQLAAFRGPSEDVIQRATARLENNIEMSVYADAFGVKGLLEKAIEKINRDIQNAALSEGEKFTKIVENSYIHVPPAVQDILARSCAQSINELINKGGLGVTLRRVPGLAAAVCEVGLRTAGPARAVVEELLRSLTDKLGSVEIVRSDLEAQLDAARGECAELQKEVKKLKTQLSALLQFTEQVKKQTRDSVQAREGVTQTSIREKDKAIVDLQDEVKRTEDDVQKAKDDATKKEEELRRVKKELKDQKEKFDAFTEEPDNWYRCGKCNERFNGCFKTVESPEGRLGFVCDYCRTPHGWLHMDYK
ncbi:hypothetical protein NA57DRAFT_77895 [Rhizodiscina lignyota]|uniref:BTB domain-containing protein n=1 Tax=Rhizodiscina lignyota TaxID=1504668 RepID=A0A9P4IE48_9PEZI|nr:hypothetical protein NA57DRAFT_77895 [Rhizodiscina lignyota]